MGSRSDKGNLNFSWTLIMAPFPVIDYVIVHKLVRLVGKKSQQGILEQSKTSYARL